jgi:hypothetical protein
MPRIGSLEISGRMTGKTTRLLARARDLADQGKSVVFVTCLYRHLPRRKGITFQGSGLMGRHTDPDAIWFFDEFEWLKGVTLREGAHYATTPKRLRDLSRDTPDNDLLLALIDANGGGHVRHPFLTGDRELGHNFRASFPDDDTFRREIYGEYLSIPSNPSA